MIVRHAREDDLAALARATATQPLLVRYGVTEGGLARELGRTLTAGEGLLVAEGEALLGFASFLRRGAFGRDGFLKLIAIVPGGESRGVGRALLEAVEREVAVDARHLFLMVSDFNEAAQRFYRRAGYVQGGAFPGLIKPDITELLFYRRVK
jgi:ribosomal protein S18 acetylase RimI-like enzyme